MQERRVISLRLPVDLIDGLDAYARGVKASQVRVGKSGGTHGGKDSGRTAVIEALLQAFVEGRLLEIPASSSSPFPLEERSPGETSEFPLHICLNPT